MGGWGGGWGPARSMLALPARPRHRIVSLLAQSRDEDRSQNTLPFQLASIAVGLGDHTTLDYTFDFGGG